MDIPLPVIVFVDAFPIGFLLQDGFVFLPGNDELTGFHVVDEASVGLDPLGFPFVPANVLKHFDSLKRRAGSTLLFVTLAQSPTVQSVPIRLDCRGPPARMLPAV